MRLRTLSTIQQRAIFTKNGYCQWHRVKLLRIQRHCTKKAVNNINLNSRSRIMRQGSSNNKNTIQRTQTSNSLSKMTWKLWKLKHQLHSLLALATFPGVHPKSNKNLMSLVCLKKCLMLSSTLNKKPKNTKFRRRQALLEKKLKVPQIAQQRTQRIRLTRSTRITRTEL